jgi:hypothetical protein
MNQSKPYFIVDIDLTVVDSVTGPNGWLAWLNAMTNRTDTADDLNWDYNIGKFYKEDLAKLKIDPMDWWRYPGIYDWMQPLPGAVEVIQKMYNRGYEIVFVSHCKGQHSKSKHNFLRRFITAPYSFIATKEKCKVNSGTGNDVFIDDRNEYLNMSKASVKFKFKTKWTQFEELDISRVLYADTWYCVAVQMGL